MKIRKSILFFLCACFIGRAFAGVGDSAITGMLSNVTQSSVINDQMRGGLIGGSAYIRTPNSTINFFNIDAPKFSAGCGGIDATLGGFSYVSSQKLMDFFRKVIQQAVPVAFELALKQMAPQVADALAKFQSWAQQASALTANSCQLATGIAQSAINLVDSKTNQANNDGASWMSSMGITSDMTGALDKFTSAPGAFFSNLFSSSPKDANGKTNIADATACAEGNQTWCAMNNRQNSLIGWQTNLDSDDVMSKQLIMSLIGTVIVKSTDVTDENAKPVANPYVEGTLRLKDLVKFNTGSGTLSVLVCDDPDTCLSPSPHDLQYNGIEGYVNKMLFGTADPSGNTSGQPTGVQPGSIVSNMSNQASYSCGSLACFGFSTDQIQFLNLMSNVPAMAYLKKVQHNPSLTAYVAQQLSTIMVNGAAVVYGENIYSLSRSIYQNNKASKPPGYDARMADLLTDIRAYSVLSSQEMKKLKDIVEIVDRAYQTSPELEGWKKLQQSKALRG